MAPTLDKVAQQWVTNVTTGTTKNIRTHGTGRDGYEYTFMYYDRDTIYSYGTHFPMAVAQRDEKGSVIGFVLNGDRRSNSTTNHQAKVLSAVKGTGLPHVTIPFSALEAADIVPASVTALEVLPDRIEERDHVSATIPDGAVWHREPIHEWVRKSDDELARIVAAKQAEYDKYRTRFDGERTFTVDSLERWEAAVHRVVAHRTVLRTSRRTWSPEITITTGDDGAKTYTWHTTRHWLGESLIEATVRQTVRVTCPSCRGRRHRKAAPPIPPSPLHYVPFRDRLTNKGVNLGNYEGWNNAHERHETRRLLAQGLWWEEWGCKRCKGAGRWSKTVTRRAKFLSGFDRNEDRQTYFFCEMPKTTATTVDGALEALKPDTVRIAEQMGRLVRRQGDIFAVELTGLDKRKLRKRAAVFTRQGRLFGTNHVATETAALPDGTLLARGCLTHKPSGRAPDHARIRLVGGWYVVVKNTVPLTAA